MIYPYSIDFKDSGINTFQRKIVNQCVQIDNGHRKSLATRNMKLVLSGYKH